MKEEFTSDERNILRQYIETPSGKKFLEKLVKEELANFAVAYNKGATTENQAQLVNRNAGIYWVRSLIQDLITPPENKVRLNSLK